MLNPSTADEKTNDPTIRRCIDFARRWWLGTLVVVNLFALRATNPRDLYEADNPIGGMENDAAIFDAADGADKLIAAWGNHGALRNQGTWALSLMEGLRAPVEHFGLTKRGQPRHPLYVKRSTVLQLWAA
jgi:hypothetical protein